MSKGKRTSEQRGPAQQRAAADPLQQASALYAQGRWTEAESLCRRVLEREPTHPGALSLLGIVMAQTRRPQEAAKLLGRVAAALPDHADAQTNYGNVLRALGRSGDALTCYERTLALQPDSAEAHHNRALALSDLRRYEQALESYARALAVRPGDAAVWSNRSGVLRALGRYEEALQSIERAIALQPKFIGALNNRAIVLLLLGRLEAALESIDRVLELQPNDAAAHANRSAALCRLARYDEALESVERALALSPDHARSHAQRGDILHAQERPEEALESYDRALVLQPNVAEVHARRGAVLGALHQQHQALASYERALAIDPRCVNALVNRGVTLYELKQYRDALGSLDQAIRLSPQDAQIHAYRGAVFEELNAFEEAIASYERALGIDPAIAFVRGNRCHARMRICDWEHLATDRADITAALERGEPSATPFVVLSLADAPALQRRAAEIWVRRKFCTAERPSVAPQARHEKIRIGYFSADFNDHALAVLASGLFESHDRSGFELTGFSLGPKTSDAFRGRIESAFDRFVQVDGQADRQIAALARELQIDIAVDLGGYTRDARAGIFALGAAAVQVSYLGYLGTLGGSFIDYLLADAVLVPSHVRAHYSENIAYLPSYRVNDRKRTIAERTFSRGELALPEHGFVFCCFNSTYKIAPETFESWMRILAAVPGSCLFLLGSSSIAERNLRRAAGRAGIAPQRLVFGARLSLEDYLARYRSADLFLDTMPYSAGTTASDALWAGLPVLTQAGESFASRMGASVVTAAGLPELVVQDRTAYEQRAVELARDARQLAALKERLAAHREHCALYDVARFTANLESLYRRMYERHCAGLPPQDLLCDAADPR